MPSALERGNKRKATSKMLTTRLLGLLLLVLIHCSVGIEAQQLPYARDERSLYGPPELGWNTVSGFSPLGLGHMTKDELLTLLEAWQEVEAETPAPTPKPTKPSPRPRPRPRPTQRPTPAPAPPPPQAAPPEPLAPGPTPEPGAPVNVQLPAFVPIQLSAMFTPPQAIAAGVGAGVGTGAIDAAVLDADQDMIAQSDENATPRLFRFMRLPMANPQPQATARFAQPQQVVRNTLESVDTGIAPLANLVQAKSATTYARAITNPVSPPMVLAPRPPLRPRFAGPPMPYMGSAPGRLELVPSSQIIGDWRE